MPVVEARVAGDGRGEDVRPDGSTGDFHEADRNTVNSGKRCVEDHSLETKQAEAVVKEIGAGSGTGGSQKDEPTTVGVDDAKEGRRREKHRESPLENRGRWALLSVCRSD
jgi:hypothetical protein